VVLPESPLIGKTYMQMKERGTYNFKVTRWIRGGQTLRVPFADLTFEDGDILIIETTPSDLVTIRQEQGIDLRPVEEYKDHMPVQERGDDADIPEQLVQAVIAPHAEFIGQSIGEVDFREHFGVVVLGLWRQSGLIRDEIAKVKLEAGDVLVMQGHDDGIERVRAHPGFLMMVPFQGEGRSPRKALTAAAIMIGAMVLAGSGLLELDIAMLAGAAGVVLTRCITPRQAYRSIDQRIFVFIAGAIPLGLAMRTSGVSELLAGGLATIVRPWEPFWILIAIFFIVSWLTQIMSDAATVALFAPVVISLASALGLPPEPFVVTVAMAAVASFWTPIGHHGNMLIYSPGRYTFKDFILVGGVLTVIVAFIVATLTLALWGSLPPV
jgi:di/tricarboxylate transporter